MKLTILQMILALGMSLVSFGLTIVQRQPVKSVIPTPNPTLNSNKQFNQLLIFEVPPPPEGIDAPTGRTSGATQVKTKNDFFREMVSEIISWGVNTIRNFQFAIRSYKQWGLETR
jgi:hypothetical protein